MTDGPPSWTDPPRVYPSPPVVADSPWDAPPPPGGWRPFPPPPPNGPAGPRRPSLSASGRALVAVALVSALIGAGVGALVAHTTGGGAGQTVVEKFTGNTSLIKQRPSDIQGILAKVLPAVVTIDAYTTNQPQGGFGPFFGGGSSSGSPVLNDEGTGMIITSNGQVITNNHVISGASTLTVTLNGSNRQLPAKVIASDPDDDIALIQIENESGLATVSFGNSDKIQVGDGVVAIGNALGLQGGPTVTAGIISAEGRGLTVQDPNTGQQITLTDMLQTDAAINPGNSGGPLVDASGQVIGMNSDEATGSGQQTAQNIGFAIPSNKITGLLPLLRKGGTVTPPLAYLGVEGTDETPQIQAEYGLTPSQGALIEAVLPGTPAAKAGLQPGDVIVSIDGNPVTSWNDLTQELRDHKPGDTVDVGLYRATRQLSLKVTLGTAPAGAP